MGQPLLVFAMEEESQDVFSDYTVLHTGIGKVNAAYALTKYLMGNDRPGVIVNMGTAGSRTHAPGSVVNARSFIQRDMDVTALGVEAYQTPFSDDPVVLEYGRSVDALAQGVCGTGDNFDVSDRAAQFDVVDMEAYALALIAQREGIPFLCLKYISDGADGEADVDWNEALHRAAERLLTVLKGIDL